VSVTRRRFAESLSEERLTATASSAFADVIRSTSTNMMPEKAKTFILGFHGRISQSAQSLVRS
jgi:hypothetical protein